LFHADRAEIFEISKESLSSLGILERARRLAWIGHQVADLGFAGSNPAVPAIFSHSLFIIMGFHIPLTSRIDITASPLNAGASRGKCETYLLKGALSFTVQHIGAKS
jgi:hypothetical protein